MVTSNICTLQNVNTYNHQTHLNPFDPIYHRALASHQPLSNKSRILDYGIQLLKSIQ